MTIERPSNSKFFIHRFRDGDTCEGVVQCRCCGAMSAATLRILNIESWEPRGVNRARATLVSRELTERYRGRMGYLSPPIQRRDNYGRILGDVELDEGSLSGLLVASGHAWWGVGEPEPRQIVPPGTTSTPINQR